MPVTDELNVLEGLWFVTPNGGKGALCSHISQHMVKSLSELEKSHSWRFGPQRSETFSRVAELRKNFSSFRFSRWRDSYIYWRFILPKDVGG